MNDPIGAIELDWDAYWRETARETPDARAKRSLNEKKDKVLGWMQECFCINCGKSGGMIAKEWAAYVSYLCDDCIFMYGRPPLEEIPEQFLKG